MRRIPLVPFPHIRTSLGNARLVLERPSALSSRDMRFFLTPGVVAYLADLCRGRDCSDKEVEGACEADEDDSELV